MRKVFAGVLVVVLALAGYTAHAPIASAVPIGYTQATISGMDNIYEIDLGTGSMTLVGATGLSPATRALTLGPTGTLYGANAGNLITIDTATGAGTVVGPFGCCSTVDDMAFDAGGNLWLISGSPSSLYSVNVASGAATLVGSVGGRFLSGLAGDCSGSVFGLDAENDDLLTVNTATAAPTAVGPLGFDVASGSLDEDAAGTLWMLARPPVGGAPSETYTINKTTGAATLVVGSVDGNNPSDVAIAPLVCQVPPTTTTTTTTAPSTTTAAPTTTTTAPGSTTTTTGSVANQAATPVRVTPALTG